MFFDIFRVAGRSKSELLGIGLLPNEEIVVTQADPSETRKFENRVHNPSDSALEPFERYKRPHQGGNVAGVLMIRHENAFFIHQLF